MNILSLIEELEQIMDDGGSVPFSKKITINPDEVYEVINDLRESIPQEIKDAQWVNQERERILQEANSQASAIKDKAREEVERSYEDANRKLRELVNQDTITVEARKEAEKIIAEAKETANTIATNSLAYVDQILAKTSDELKNTLSTIEENRSQLKY
ncbi:ATPase [Helcococcus ovis]|uniref:ATPase n=1 Tax=Helcococcus ovis TaxID=72026 RepID=A0A4R9C2G7_9FIRM|nr:ATPase [Helcococcus ovis]TFF64894.1 ATPase [Helcococcus ovis]TFF67171.1 ATPase [Helcococcus ovis]TFF67365.1 ATPase [Helcococcus ovis]WNZ01888.1 ATPase [Helcococcus ovis]